MSVRHLPAPSTTTHQPLATGFWLVVVSCWRGGRRYRAKLGSKCGLGLALFGLSQLRSRQAVGRRWLHFLVACAAVRPPESLG